MARRQLVVFKIGGEEFAVDIMLTREVVLMRDITPVPESQGYVEGIMNLRGNLVPVLDLSKRLGASNPVTERERKIIITTLDGKMAGLIVDGASEVVRVTDDMIEAVPDLINEIGVDYIGGVVNVAGRYITLIDFEKALSTEVVGDLDHVIQLLANQREFEPARAV